MPTWTQKLKAHGESKKRTAQKPPISAIVQEAWVQIRPSSGNDPGAVIPAFYTVEDGVLTVTDETGRAIEGLKPHRLQATDDPRVIAKRLALAHWQESNAFNRPLRYTTPGVA